MEIEIKASVENPKETEARIIALGAVLIDECEETDIYYTNPVKDLRESKEYIRLRCREDTTIFAYHQAKSDFTEETETSVGNLDAFRRILHLTGFEVLGTIVKKRRCYHYNEFKLLLDVVKDIGVFLEIETEGSAEEASAKREACLNVLDLIHLPRSSLTNVWYCDIATGKANRTS